MQFAPQQQPQVLPRTSTPSTKNLHRPLQARGSSTLLLRPCARMPPLLHAETSKILNQADCHGARVPAASPGGDAGSAGGAAGALAANPPTLSRVASDASV